MLLIERVKKGHFYLGSELL